MSQAVIIVRGLPGSGKTSWIRREQAEHRLPAGAVFSADLWFERMLGHFDARRLDEAHAYEQAALIRALGQGQRIVALDATHSRRWEWCRVAAAVAALEHANREVDLRVVDLFDAGLSDAELARRTVHDVPVHVIAAMRRRWEP